MAPIRDEDERREVIRRLEQEYLRAKREHAETQPEHAEAEAALSRLQLPLPPGDVCPECWITHGHTRPLRAVLENGAPQYRRMRCDHCEYSQNWKTGL